MFCKSKYVAAQIIMEVVVKNLIRAITGLLVIVGAVNWGLVGAFNMNLVHSLFGTAPMIEKYVYIAVGVAGLIFAALEFNEHSR